MNEVPTYTLFDNPWIPAEPLKGESRPVSLHEILKKAHTFRGVCAANPLEEFALVRFMMTVLMDVYSPQHWDDIETIIQSGRFDGEKIDAYREKWKGRFDLFDPAYPFLQVPFSRSEKCQKPAANIFLEWPAGNSHIMFNHALESSHAFTPAQCAVALCTIALFATRYGNKKCKSVTGIPPIFLHYDGRTLFETLTLNMIPASAVHYLDFDDPPVQWRDNPVRADFAPCAKVSLLSGLISRPLDIQLIPEQDAAGNIVVRTVQYGRGWDYDAIENWRDPDISQKQDGKPLMGKAERAVWRDLGVVLEQRGRPVWMSDIRQRMNMLPDPPEMVPVHAYVPVARFKSTSFYMTSWFDERFMIENTFLNDVDKVELLNDFLAMLESVGDSLRKIFFWTSEQLEKRKKNTKESDELVRMLAPEAFTAYLEASRVYLLTEWMPIVDAANVVFEWDAALRKSTGSRILHIALDCFDYAVQTHALTARVLKWCALAKPFLTGQIIKKLKEGGWRYDDPDHNSANPTH